MRKLILALLATLFCLTTFAQELPFTGTKSKKASKYFGEGLVAYTANDYNKAMPQLKRAVQEDSNFVDAWMLIADIYELNDQYEEAFYIYKRAIAIAPGFQIPYYKLSRAALEEGAYDSSLYYINQYLTLKGNQIDPARVDKIKAIAEYGIEAMKHPVPFDPKNLGPSVNSPLDEYFPGVTTDDKTLIYTRLQRNITEDFYISHRTPEGWSPSENMGPPINTNENEGTVSLSSDGQYVFFTGCNRPDGEGSCDLYFSALDGDTWKEPRNLGFPINTRAWDSQPSLSFDGKTLYFSSSRPGGFGQSDIWYSTYSKGKWSAPVNMGPLINTPGEEQVPFIAKDDQTLYFTSDYHPGMGKMDIFVTRKQPDGRWGKPMNLGYPINTQNDERGLVVSTDGKNAFYVSNRSEGYGRLDIYSFDLYDAAQPQKTGYIKGLVYDAKTKKKLRAKIELIDLETGKTVIEVVSNRVTGEFLACLQGNKNYALNVSSDGYLFYSENFSLKNQSSTEPLLLDIPLNPILAGERVVLKNVFFDVDKFTLRNESKIELDKLIAFMKANPTLKIELGGHTDNTGDKTKNMSLSANRAKAVYDYLIQNGIEQTRLSYKGYADTQPVADNKTEAGKQKNRRTEFKIISK